MGILKILAVCAAICAVTPACGRKAEDPPAGTGSQASPAVGNEAYATFVSRFIEARMKRDPYFAVQAGRHEFDGLMPEWTRAAMDADIAELRELKAELKEYDPATLSEAQQFERDYLRWVIDRDLFWMATAEAPYRNPAWYLDRLDPSMYLTREYAPLEKRLQGFLGYARAIPALAGSIRANLRTPLPVSFIERGASGFGGYATFFRNETPPVFAQLADAKLKQDLVDATLAAARAMDELEAWLQSQRATR